MKNKQRLVVLFGALAALIAILAIVPVFGADATQRFPDPSDAADTAKDLVFSRQGTNINSGAPFIMIEVTDADLDVGATVTNKAKTTCLSGDNFTIDRFTTLTDPRVTSSAPVIPPILDNNADGNVDYNDVGTNALTIQVDSVNSLNGSITFRCTGAQTDRHFTYTYKKGAVDKTAVSSATTGIVKVTSDADPTGIAVRLEESSAQTGIFRGVVKLIKDASTTTATCLNLKATGCGGGAVVGSTTTTAADSLASGLVANGTWSVGALLVNENDTVVFTYVDSGTGGAAVSRTASIKVESTAPAFTNPAPANAIAQSNNLPTVSGDTTDSDSGVDETVLTVIWGIDKSIPANGKIDLHRTSVVASGNVTAITDGFTFEQQLPSMYATTDDHVIYWWIKSTDKAGNVGISDREAIILGVADTCDPTSTVFTGTNLKDKDVAVTADIAGCQPYSVSVDRTNPDLASAVTGSWWDTAKTTDDKTETSVTLALNTSIRLDFDAALDDTTVQLTDFEVDDSTPLSFSWFSTRAQSVFLTVAALSPNARPKIEVVAEVRDKAGNKVASDVITNATDGIAPTLTLAPTDRPVTKAAQSITLTSNENASTATVNLEVVQITNSTTAGAPTVVPVTGGPTTWSGSISPSANGLYNVRADATDVNVTTNTGSVGQATAGGATIDLTKATLFEVDKGIPAPIFIPSTTTDDPNAIISVNFVDEGKEYGLNSDGIHTNTPADVVTTFDTHATVTVSSATLTGSDLVAVDIAAAISSADGIQFLYKHPTALAEGDHTIKIKVKDEAENEVEFTNTFKVTARAQFSIPLVPGWNMVSFPADPTDPAIDAVIGTSVPVTAVMAYKDGVWLIATREKDSAGVFGTFAGNLSAINSKLGYWVFTDTFEPIKTLIPRLAGGAPSGSTPRQPPTVKIVPGWNLVPVLDVTGDETAAAASDIDADVYFASLADVTRVYNFDTQLSTWNAVVLDAVNITGDKVRHGKAYWVYSTKAGTLAP